MNDLLLMLASVMPKDMLINHLSKEIDEYKANPTDQQFEKIATIATLVSSKLIIDKEGIEKILKDTETMRSGFDMLSPKLH